MTGSRGFGARGVVLVGAALVALLAVAPPASAFEKGFWGPTRVNGASQFPIYRDLGVTLYQMQLPWFQVAPTRPANPTDPNDPAYRWPEEADFAVGQAGANGMGVLMMVKGSPGWANGGRPPNWAPTNPKDYADFMTAASRRYPSVRHWMIWGEPTRSANFLPQRGAARRYARILDAAYGAVKAQSRSDLVIGGNSYFKGSSSQSVPFVWVRRLRLSNGRPPRMDLYGHNPFGSRRPSLSRGPFGKGFADFADLGRFRVAVSRNLGRGRGPRLFLSEWTLPTAKGDSEFSYYVLPRTQPSWIRDGFRVAHRVGAYGLGWVHLYDEPGPKFFSGLLDSSGQRKPGYFAFKRAR